MMMNAAKWEMPSPKKDTISTPGTSHALDLKILNPDNPSFDLQHWQNAVAHLSALPGGRLFARVLLEHGEDGC